MTFRVVRRTSCQVTDWAGGRTVQLEIYPPEADYKKRDFKFRLSTATCTSDGESPFTVLPGVYRHLMILDGQLRVRHEGHHEVTLHPYDEVDSFEGGWSTFSEGKVRDFNLMLSKGWSGTLAPVTEDCDEPITPNSTYVAFFCGAGRAQLTLASGATVVLGTEDMAVVEEITALGSVHVALLDGGKVIRADMKGK